MRDAVPRRFSTVSHQRTGRLVQCRREGPWQTCFCWELLHARRQSGEATRARWVAQGREIKLPRTVPGEPGQSEGRKQIKSIKSGATVISDTFCEGSR